MAKIVKCKECGQDKEHKAFGLCVSCYRRDYYHKHREQEIQKSHKYQVKHKEHYNKLKRDRRNRLKNNGICQKCGKNPINYNSSVVYCSECNFQHMISCRKSYYKSKVLGLCQRCGKNIPLYTKTRCYECEMKAHQKPKDYTQELIQANEYIENYLKEKNITLSNNVTKV